MRYPVLALAALIVSSSALMAQAQSAPPGQTLAKVRGYEFLTLPNGQEGVAYTVDTYATGRPGADGQMVITRPPQSLRIVQPAGKSRPFYAGANVVVSYLGDGEARVGRMTETNEFQGGTGFYSVINGAPLQQEMHPSH
jgi:hypothetical protein